MYKNSRVSVYFYLRHVFFIKKMCKFTIKSIFFEKVIYFSQKVWYNNVAKMIRMVYPISSGRNMFLKGAIS